MIMNLLSQLPWHADSWGFSSVRISVYFSLFLFVFLHKRKEGNVKNVSLVVNYVCSWERVSTEIYRTVLLPFSIIFYVLNFIITISLSVSIFPSIFLFPGSFLYLTLYSLFASTPPPPPPVAQHSLVSQGILIIDASRSHSDTPQPVWHLATHNIHKRHTSMPPTGFELTIPISERPQTYALVYLH
jgi:hypothetical protein